MLWSTPVGSVQPNTVLAAEDAVDLDATLPTIADIALLTSWSMAIAALALGLEVPIEPAETLQFELEWQQRKLDGLTGSGDPLTIH